jgi:NAD+-dependent secondary alcohol dehydrogenase Adh1
VVVGAGGLGHIGIQLLRIMSATRIIAVDTNPAALRLATGWGADEVVPADGDHVRRVLDLTHGRGADVVFDFVAENGAERDSWQLTRRAGSHFIIGYGGTLHVSTIDLISTDRNIVGNLVGSYTDLAELMVLAQTDRVGLHTRTYPLDAVNDAMDDLEAGRLQGRGILVP